MLHFVCTKFLWLLKNCVCQFFQGKYLVVNFFGCTGTGGSISNRTLSFRFICPKRFFLHLYILDFMVLIWNCIFECTTWTQREICGFFLSYFQLSYMNGFVSDHTTLYHLPFHPPADGRVAVKVRPWFWHFWCFVEFWFLDPGYPWRVPRSWVTVDRCMISIPT